MKPKEFYDKVVAMRKAQKDYFKFRSSAYLQTSLLGDVFYTT